MPPAKKAEYVRVRESFSTREGFVYRAGMVFAADDPIVKSNPDQFGPLEVHSSRGDSGPRLEATTAFPGEQRGEG